MLHSLCPLLFALCSLPFAKSTAFARPPSPLPTLSAAFQPPPPSDQPLAPGVPQVQPPPAPSEKLLRLKSDLPVRYFPDQQEWRTVDGTGTIQLTFRELTVFARRIRYSERGKILEATEGVRALFQQGVEFDGGRAVYYADERRWLMEGGKATIEPSYFREGGVVAPLYLTVQQMRGTDQRLTAERSTFSSCDRPNPHYSLRSRTVDVIPDDRLILRDTGFFLGGNKLLGIGRYTISLKPRRQRSRLPFTPEVGNDQISGTFIRMSIALLDTRSQTGNLLLDWSERRGLGYGLEHTYNFRNAQGGLNFLVQRSPFAGTEQNFSFRHQQRLFAGLLLTALWDERRNTPYFGGQSFSNSSRQISLRKSWTRGMTELTLRTLGYGGFGGRSSDRTWTLTHNISTHLQSINLMTTLREFTRPGQPTDKELNERLEVRRQLSNQWDLALRFEQRVDLDRDRFSGDNFFYALDRTPELAFIFRPRKQNFWLPNATLGLARWGEPQFVGVGQTPQRLTTERLHLRLEAPYRTLRIKGNLQLSQNATFEQFLYGNDTAQYLFGYRGTLNWGFEGKSQLELGYWMQKHKGFTPFRSDTLTDYENLDLRLNISPSEKFLLSATTGLDIERDFFRDALINLRWQPSQGKALDLSTGYSIERGQWQDILGRLLLSKPSGLGLPTYGTLVSYYPTRPTPFAEERPAPPPGGFRSELVFRYSPQKGQLARVRLFLDWSITKSWRLETLLGYSGVLRKLDIAQFRLTRDFHCYQVWVVYNREQREFRFFFVIKAFPLLQQFFGTSNQGAFLDTSLGQVY